MYIIIIVIIKKWWLVFIELEDTWDVMPFINADTNAYKAYHTFVCVESNGKDVNELL